MILTAAHPQSEKVPRARRLVPAAAVVLIYTSVMAGGNLTVPLYALWASRFGFGPVTTTLVFIAYVIGVVGMLLGAGSLSDAIGRRPVLALALTAVSTLGFALADGLTVLLVSRVLSGAATGLITATATSSIAEIVPGRRTAAVLATAANVGGLSLGVTDALSESGNRAELSATYFLFLYSGLIVPVLLLGVLDQMARTRISSITLTVLVIAVALAGLALGRGTEPADPAPMESSRD